MQKITPCLWFDQNCEEAITFYAKIFENSKIRTIQRYPDSIKEGPMQGMEGKILTAIFELDEFVFQALDGGPFFTPNPSISFFINCKDKEEVDYFWEKLSPGGRELMALGAYPFSERYGWIQDRFGISWQINLGEEPAPMKITPSFLFVGDLYGKAEEALDFYVATFKDASKGSVFRYGPNEIGEKEEAVMYADFELEDQLFSIAESVAEHGFSFNEAISLSVECDDQAEIDYYWKALSVVPEAEQCGWLKDKYGVSWQIVPKRLGELMSDPDPEKVARVMDAFMQMKKFDIAKLEEAYAG